MAEISCLIWRPKVSWSWSACADERSRVGPKGLDLVNVGSGRGGARLTVKSTIIIRLSLADEGLRFRR